METARVSLVRLMGSPVATLMTLSVIAIALALPTVFYTVLGNMARLHAPWQEARHITLYLKPAGDESAGRTLAAQLAKRSDVAGAQVVSRTEGLAEFRAWSGLGEAVDALGHNPLPVLVVVAARQTQLDAVRELRTELARLAPVDQAELDLDWLEKLEAIMQALRRAGGVIIVLLGFAVPLVIGNTIRLDIASRRTEIEVTELIGASPAFIRRPFLYTGLWYGVVGGLLAWVIAEAALRAVQGPVAQLALLYRSGYTLESLGSGPTFMLMTVSSTLGWAGAWLAVNRHLHTLEPN